MISISFGMGLALGASKRFPAHTMFDNPPEPSKKLLYQMRDLESNN